MELGGTTLPADRIVPTQVSGLGVIIAISLSSTHALALAGMTARSGLGAGTTTAAWAMARPRRLADTPVQVSNLNGVMKVFAGPDTSYAILDDGTAWAWGRNAWAQLGDGTTTTRRTPVQVSGLNDVVSIAGGISFGMAVRADGSGWNWARTTPRAWPPGRPSTSFRSAWRSKGSSTSRPATTRAWR